MLPVQEGFVKGKLILEFTQGTDKAILRFFTIAANKNIVLQKIEHKKDKPIRFQVYVSDFHELREIKRKSGVRYRIVKKSGLPFYLKFLRQHKGIACGALSFCILLYLLSRFLWNISFEGNSLHTQEELRLFLSEIKISEGIWLRDVPCEEIERSIRNEYFDITWVSAELTGTKLTIHIKENYDKEIASKESQPYSLIAEKDAVIPSIVTRSGTPVVQAGDIVKVGDILVSGIVPTKNEFDEELAVHYVNADADIFAQTTYTYEDRIPMKYQKKVYTGKETKSFSVSFLQQKYSFFKRRPKYEQYEQEENITQLKIAESFYLPLCIGTSEYREYEYIDSVYSKEEARNIAELKYNEFLSGLEQKGVQIIEKNGTIQFDDSWCYVNAAIISIEKIGKVLPIDEEQQTQPIQEENVTTQ